MRVKLPALVCLVVGLSAVGCSRAPAEDFRMAPTVASEPSAPLSSDPAVRSAGAPSGVVVRARAPEIAAPDPEALSSAGGTRCVRATSSAPPPPVSAGPAPGCPQDPEATGTAPSTIALEFPDVSGVHVDAELVRTEHDTERGLMYRKQMDEEHGMLFDLRERMDHRFWMHNTCIALDMLFVDSDGLIVGIVENAPPLNDDSRSVGCPSRWVLEVNAGWSRRHGVRAGQHLALPKR